MSGLCLDRKTGKILFNAVLFTNDAPEPLGNPVNGYASPTGVLGQHHVVLHFGSYGTCCLDTRTFQIAWQRRDLPCRHYRGPGSSLYHYKDLIILTMDGVDVQYLVALNQATGETVWKTPRATEWNDLQPDGKPRAEGDERKSYATPSLVKFPSGVEHLISTGSKATWAYEPASGKEIWHVNYPGFSNASSPIFGEGMALLNTGYGKANLLAVPLSEQSSGDLTSSIRWTQTKRMPLRSSPLFINGSVFTLSDDGHASLLDPKTGEPIWSERLNELFSGSPIVVEGKILCCGENGSSYWLEASPVFKVIAEAKLNAGLLASPVAVDHELYLRSRTHLYRIEQKGR
jgi:outer membrane protein assembly factor BamB